MAPAQPTPARITAIVAVLASLDLDQSEAFYTQRLGFKLHLRTDDYLILQRDGCELHLWLGNDPHIAQNTSCYVRGQVDVLHAEFSAHGLALKPPVNREWGMRELYVIDPHGNLLKFGEPTDPLDN